MRKNKLNDKVIKFIRSLYGKNRFIPLHEPKFIGNEKRYLKKCIDTTYVSSSGYFIDELEKKISTFTGSKFAILTNSGTAALHICLLLAKVGFDDEVITQPLTFVATCNAINYCNAKPIFIDVDLDTMGLSPSALKSFLKKNTKIINKKCINKKTNKVIKACIPMHSYGHPCKIDEIKKICDDNFIFLIEDAAESLGSMYMDKHTGNFGKLSALSFNGNKIITGGGGGCILTNNQLFAKKAKHLCTTAKLPHKWKYNHNFVGFNYRMNNINAAILVAQIENLNLYIESKRYIAETYEIFFNKIEYNFFKEPINSKSNYWLNSILLKNQNQRDNFLKDTNSKGIMTRPAWTLMNKLPMFKKAQTYNLQNSLWLEERLVNIPSSVLL